MALTAKDRAEIEAAYEEVFGRKPLRKPKVVARNDLGTIRDADVPVSRADPNTNGQARVVQVRRPDWVTINFEALDQQMRATHRAYDAAERRQRRDELDPFGLGHWGPNDD